MSDGRDRTSGRGRRGQRGQAALELALCLPLLFVVLLAVVQIGLLVVDRLAVAQAAREAARRAIVDADPVHIRAAALGGGLRPDRLEVRIGPRPPPGGLIEIRVRYRAPTDVPIAGALLPDVTLDVSAAMIVEDPPAA